MGDSFSLWDTIFLDFYLTSKVIEENQSQDSLSLKQQFASYTQEDSEKSSLTIDNKIDIKNFFMIDCIALAMIMYVKQDGIIY